MASQNVFVIGGSGMVGRALIAAHPGWISVGRGQAVEMDLSTHGPQSPAPAFGAPADCVVFSAAMSKPGDCEKNPALCEQINITATGALIQSWLERGTRVVFFSSDLVFDGSAPTYPEDTPHAPVGIYGNSKSRIEKRFQGHPLFKVARLSYVVSPEDGFTAQIAAHARESRLFTVLDPLWRSAVAIDDVVAGIGALADNFEAVEPGVINFGGPATRSRSDMAAAFQAAWQEPIAVAVERPPADFYRLRPERIDLLTERFAAVLGRRPLSVEAAYQAMVPALRR